jgi:hypothetical protein
MGLMEYIYCGGFHSKIEPEDAWVMYTFVVKRGIICTGLKERACYLFYNSLSPDNLLDLIALNRYGFTINTLPYNPADSPRFVYPLLPPPTIRKVRVTGVIPLPAPSLLLSSSPLLPPLVNL